MVGLRKFLTSEIKALCSDPYLLNKSKEALSNFSWDDFYELLKVKAPTILAFLEACVSRSSALNSHVVVGVCAAILAKARRPAASLFQHIISIILYSGHCGKKVCFGIYNVMLPKMHNLQLILLRCLPDFKSLGSACQAQVPCVLLISLGKGMMKRYSTGSVVYSH